MKLNPKLREQLKTPLGILIQEKDTTLQNILKHIPENSYVITVGDATTEKMLNFGIVPSLQIIDGLEKRSKRELPKSSATKILCQNPPAQITDESIDAIKKAYASRPPTQILVTGEEDLLVIPACIHAPRNSVVLYGQPNEGLVIVQVTDEIRNKTKNLLESMD